MNKIGIIGGGNIGTSLAMGLVNAGIYQPENIIISKRNPASLDYLKKSGFNILSDNAFTVSNSEIIIIAVLPQQFDAVISQISSLLDSARHLLISVVSGVSIQQIEAKVNNVPIVRAMPNTAIAIQESMTCIAANARSASFQNEVKKIFEPFYTGKASGTGLGLAIVQKIIEQHNASIKLLSSIRGETVFELIFKN